MIAALTRCFLGQKYLHGLSLDDDKDLVFTSLGTTHSYVEDEAAALVGSEEFADGAEVVGSRGAVGEEGKGDNAVIADGENGDVRYDD